jgi:hypothetical protein
MNFAHAGMGCHHFACNEIARVREGARVAP